MHFELIKLQAVLERNKDLLDDINTWELAFRNIFVSLVVTATQPEVDYLKAYTEFSHLIPKLFATWIIHSSKAENKFLESKLKEFITLLICLNNWKGKNDKLFKTNLDEKWIEVENILQQLGLHLNKEIQLFKNKIDELFRNEKKKTSKITWGLPDSIILFELFGDLGLAYVKNFKSEFTIIGDIIGLTGNKIELIHSDQFIDILPALIKCPTIYPSEIIPCSPSNMIYDEFIQLVKKNYKSLETVLKKSNPLSPNELWELKKQLIVTKAETIDILMKNSKFFTDKHFLSVFKNLSVVFNLSPKDYSSLLNSKKYEALQYIIEKKPEVQIGAQITVESENGENEAIPIPHCCMVLYHASNCIELKEFLSSWLQRGLFHKEKTPQPEALLALAANPSIDYRFFEIFKLFLENGFSLTQKIGKYAPLDNLLINNQIVLIQRLIAYYQAQNGTDVVNILYSRLFVAATLYNRFDVLLNLLKKNKDFESIISSYPYAGEYAEGINRFFCSCIATNNIKYFMEKFGHFIKQLTIDLNLDFIFGNNQLHTKIKVDAPGYVAITGDNVSALKILHQLYNVPLLSENSDIESPLMILLLKQHFNSLNYYLDNGVYFSLNWLKANAEIFPKDLFELAWMIDQNKIEKLKEKKIENLLLYRFLKHTDTLYQQQVSNPPKEGFKEFALLKENFNIKSELIVSLMDYHQLTDQLIMSIIPDSIYDKKVKLGSKEVKPFLDFIHLVQSNDILLKFLLEKARDFFTEQLSQPPCSEKLIDASFLLLQKCLHFNYIAIVRRLYLEDELTKRLELPKGTTDEQLFLANLHKLGTEEQPLYKNFLTTSSKNPKIILEIAREFLLVLQEKLTSIDVGEKLGFLSFNYLLLSLDDRLIKNVLNHPSFKTETKYLYFKELLTNSNFFKKNLSIEVQLNNIKLFLPFITDELFLFDRLIDSIKNQQEQQFALLKEALIVRGFQYSKDQIDCIGKALPNSKHAYNDFYNEINQPLPKKKIKKKKSKAISAELVGEKAQPILNRAKKDKNNYRVGYFYNCPLGKKENVSYVIVKNKIEENFHVMDLLKDNIINGGIGGDKKIVFTADVAPFKARPSGNARIYFFKKHDATESEKELIYIAKIGDHGQEK